MFEKIRAKFEQAKQWVSQRFDLDTKLGVFKADVQLSAMVVARKVTNEVEKIKENPKGYFADKWENLKDGVKKTQEFFINKIEMTRQEEKPKFEGDFVDRLSNWYRNQAEGIFRFSEKVTKSRMMWEMEKLDIAKDQEDKRMAIVILERIVRLNEKRSEYKNKKVKLHEFNLFLNNQLALAT